jgi:hypothetical protein
MTKGRPELVGAALRVIQGMMEAMAVGAQRLKVLGVVVGAVAIPMMYI